MKFGVFLPSFLFPGTGPEHAAQVRAFARHAEELGFDSLWITDHIVTATQFYAVSWLDSLMTLLRTGNDKEEGAPTIDIFGELAKDFSGFVAVVGEVANATLAKGVATSRGVLKLYERWLKTRNERLGEALASQGFVAPRGGRVLS